MAEAAAASVAAPSTLLHGSTPSPSEALIPGLGPDPSVAEPALNLRRPAVDQAPHAATRRALIAAGLVGCVLLLVAGIQLGARGDRSDAGTQPAAAAVASEDAAQTQAEAETTAPPESPEPPEESGATELRVPAGGMWIVVLESIPKAEHDLSYALAEAAVVSVPGASVEVIDSDVTPGLNAGYWVVMHGDFAARADAAQACSGLGREVGGECYPRLIG